MAEIQDKSVTVDISFKLCFSGCIIEYKSLDTLVKDMSLILRNNDINHLNSFNIDITSILSISKLNSCSYKIDTEDCVITISL